MSIRLHDRFPPTKTVPRSAHCRWKIVVRLYGMSNTRSLFLMTVAPFILLVLSVLALRSVSTVACIVAGLIGLAGVAVAPWREPVKVAVAGIYMLIALIGMPILNWCAVWFVFPRV
jgi:hypothetical protein